MRFDKFTTQFQQAFADAQSLAVGNDNPYIEPQHLLSALVNQQDGSTASLLARAGGNVGGLRAALKSAIERLPKVEGAGGDHVKLHASCQALEDSQKAVEKLYKRWEELSAKANPV